MRIHQTGFAAAVLFMAGTVAQAAPYSTFDPRSMGMGGAGVAAGTGTNAVFLNPSLLAGQHDTGRFSLDLPVTGSLSDPDNLLAAAKDFKDNEPVTQLKNAIDAYEADNSAANQAAVQNAGNQLIADLRKVSGKELQAEGNAALVLAVPRESFGFSVFANAYVIGGAVSHISNADIDAIEQAVDSASGGGPVVDPTANLSSSVEARFATVAESGIGMATRLDSLGGIAVGITPKFVQVTTYDYAFSGSQLDDTDIDLDKGKRTRSDFNMDLGLAKDFGNGWFTGLSVRNLISRDYETVQGNLFRIEPQARLGTAYHFEWLTVAADVDLTENKPASFEGKTRYAILGGEFDLMRTVQLRLGYRHNLSTLTAGERADVFSAGFGFSPFGLHLDTAVTGNQDEIGGALQLGYSF